MKKLLPIFILILAFSFSVFGQECPMPSIQNIMPGMSLAQVEKQLGRKLILEKNKSFKYLTNVKNAFIKNLKGVELLAIVFYRNTVFVVAVIYDDSVKWESLAEFFKVAVKNLNLPIEKIEYSPFISPYPEKEPDPMYLVCDNFILIPSYSYFRYELKVTSKELSSAAEKENTANLKKIQERNERKKQVFKP